MIKIITYFFQSIFIYLFFIIARIIGLNISRKLFAFIFSFFGPFFKSKKIIKKNLDIFSSKVPSIKKNEITTSMWKNYGMTFIEYIFLKYFRHNNSHIIFKDMANLHEITIKKKPVIFISGHFANFELMSMEITKTNTSCNYL